MLLTMDSKQFTAFRDLTHELTGVTIADTRQSMLESRVARRMRSLGTEDLEEYLNCIMNDPVERARFVDQVTTHETSFFRTPRIWNYLENEYLPAWHTQNPGRECKIWSGAASTGEEPYSLAILMKQYAQANPGFSYSIRASDISEDVIEKCRHGLYQDRAVSRFRTNYPELYQRYLHVTDAGFEVVEQIKESVVFCTHNLFHKPLEIGAYDLVLLRNVLIYFTAEDQSLVLNQVRRSMKNEGVLVIGESESIAQGEGIFTDLEPFIYQASAAGRV